MNKKTLFLIEDYNSSIYKYIEYEYIYPVENNFIIFKFINKILRKFNINYQIYNRNWTKRITSFDYVVVLDAVYSKKLINYIKKKNIHSIINLFFINTIDDYNLSFLENSKIDNIYTFDKKDSLKYNLSFNNYFYPNIILPNKKKISDFVFLGMAKSREYELLNLKKILNKNGFITDFTIVDNRKSYITYEEYLNRVSQSKVIVDWVNGHQSGLTRRPYESMFLQIKLMTNMKNIKEYDFYDRNNIFILGEDDINKLDEFIDSSFNPIKQEILQKYTFEYWINSFY